MKGQPLSKKELIEKAQVSPSQFHRVIPLLEQRGIVAKAEDEYVLGAGSYADVLVQLDRLFGFIRRRRPLSVSVSLEDLANILGKPPEKIASAAYEAANKHGFRIGSEGGYSIMKVYFPGTLRDIIEGLPDEVIEKRRKERGNNLAADP